MLTNNSEFVKAFNQIGSRLSNHDIIFATIAGPCILLDNKPSTFRNYKAVNVRHLINDLNNSNLNNIFACTEVNSMLEIFNDVMLRLLEKHAPIMQSKSKPGINSTQPWYTRQIELAAIDRDTAKSNLKMDYTPVNRRTYNTLRNKVNQMVIDAKEAYLKPRLDVKVGMKSMWKNVKSLGLAAGSTNLPSPAFTADEFNMYSAGVVDTNHSNIPTASTQSVWNVQRPVSSTSLPDHSEGSTRFSFRTVREDEIYKSLMSIKSNAVGLDNIPLPFIKLTIFAVMPHIKHLLNFSITSSKFADDWKTSKVRPGHKRTRFYNLADFRALHILPVLSKLFEKLLAEQIYDFIRSRRLMTSIQSGFRPVHSTATALLKITHDITSALDKRLIAVLLLLDFSKAFDSVNHHLLCSKLESQFFFDVTAINLISSYLANRKQAVDIDGSLSSFIQLTKGVPAGSILGPLLFCIFVNDLPNSINYMFAHLYADDAQLYKFFSTNALDISIEQINSDLQMVHNWSVQNMLELNAHKSKVIIIGGKNISSVPVIKMNGVEIIYSKSVKNLGLIMNDNWTWSDQAAKISQRISMGLRSLWPLAKSTPIKTRIILAKALLLPHVDYCSPVFFYGLDAESMNVLKLSVNAIVRYVYGLRSRDSVERHTKRFLGSSLDIFLTVRSMCFLYKLERTGQPAYLRELMHRGQSDRSMQMVIPLCNLEIGKKTLFVQGLIVWNSIPVRIRMMNSIDVFKARCTELFSRRNNPSIYSE